MWSTRRGGWNILPMADSIILATARANSAILWTQDEHFKDLEDVKYVEKKYSP